MRSAFLVELGAAALLALSACGDEDTGPSPLCAEAEEHSDLEWIQANIFDRSCANFSACHQGAASSAGGLNLEAGNAAPNLIDVPSDVAAELGFEMDLVEPGAPQDSYLLHILGAYGATIEDNPRIEPSVGFMPYNNELLCPEKVAAVERWVDSL